MNYFGCAGQSTAAIMTVSSECCTRGRVVELREDEHNQSSADKRQEACDSTTVFFLPKYRKTKAVGEICLRNILKLIQIRDKYLHEVSDIGLRLISQIKNYQIRQLQTDTKETLGEELRWVKKTKTTAFSKKEGYQPKGDRNYPNPYCSRRFAAVNEISRNNVRIRRREFFLALLQDFQNLGLIKKTS